MKMERVMMTQKSVQQKEKEIGVSTLTTRVAEAGRNANRQGYKPPSQKGRRTYV